MFLQCNNTARWKLLVWRLGYPPNSSKDRIIATAVAVPSTEPFSPVAKGEIMISWDLTLCWGQSSPTQEGISLAWQLASEAPRDSSVPPEGIGYEELFFEEIPIKKWGRRSRSRQRAASDFHAQMKTVKWDTEIRIWAKVSQILV